MEIYQIIREVCSYFDQDPKELNSKTRLREIVQTRQICMYFAKKFTKKSLAQIGSEIGGKDHATTLHAFKTVSNLYETDKEYRKIIDSLELSILQIKIATPRQIMLQVRLSDRQYRNGRYIYTFEGKIRASRLRNLFIPATSIDHALKMMKLEEVDSMNLYLNYRPEPKPVMVEARL